MSNAETLRIMRLVYHNYSRKFVAENAGINKNYLCKLENGYLNITPYIIRKLAGFYNVNSVGITRLFRDMNNYDITKPDDYQKALIKISTFFLENKLTSN